MSSGSGWAAWPTSPHDSDSHPNRSAGGRKLWRRKITWGGLYELRIDWGPGYRVYYGKIDAACVLLLCGGVKRRQSADISRARAYWKDYAERTETE
jgi:hypothetical protein